MRCKCKTGELITICAAQPSNYAVAKSLMQQLHTLHVDMCPDIYTPLSPALSWEEYARYLSADMAVVAKCGNDAVVGLLLLQERMLSARGQTERRELLVQALVTDTPWRRRGIGKMLLLYAQQKAVQQGYDTLRLQVRAANEQARAMYRACGFAEASINLEKRLPHGRMK